MIWQPTWEAAELLLANPDFKAYVDSSYENADTSTQLNAQSKDQEIDSLTKQGYDGCTQHFENMWDSSQGQNIRDKAIFITDTVNSQANIQPTWKCEIWVRDVDLLKPGSNKDSEGEPKIPEHITCQAANAQHWKKGKRFQYVLHPEAHYDFPPKMGTSYYQAKNY